jgi:branched-chain amino acid aminotransferase
MSEKFYLNGELLHATAARVSVSNPSFQHGVGLFETLRAYEGRPFALDRHVARMRESARKLDMAIGNVLDEVEAAVRAVIQANNLGDARLRFTVTPPGLYEDPPRPTLLVMAQATTGYPPELYEQGMTVCVADQFRQSAWEPLAGHKTTCYYPRLVALRQAQAKGCGEAIWATPGNYLAEGSLSNLFLVKAGRLRTPPVDTPVLPGVTRSVVLELAQAENMPADEAPCTINDLLDADEVFLTNAIMEVMPVARVERRGIGAEKPGPITRQLAGAYGRLVAQG